ncbi:hypothetical protein B5V00_09375 [Geothermobacter hydrogeniphilus]|uniref:Uncharacterized protein n=1 Tax=Geothermobacter hydrogeniphilus TaxID=1969733 RepID=A0A1X0Y488_9BACT|nr:hypothetical protein B5V00_09375 [Geothermobacter hydrogeniphilus]
MRNFRSYPSAGGQFQELFPARSRDEFAPGLPVRNLDAGTGVEVVVGDCSFRAFVVDAGDAVPTGALAPLSSESLSFAGFPIVID